MVGRGRPWSLNLWVRTTTSFRGLQIWPVSLWCPEMGVVDLAKHSVIKHFLHTWYPQCLISHSSLEQVLSMSPTTNHTRVSYSDGSGHGFSLSGQGTSRVHSSWPSRLVKGHGVPIRGVPASAIFHANTGPSLDSQTPRLWGQRRILKSYSVVDIWNQCHTALNSEVRYLCSWMDSLIDWLIFEAEAHAID